MLMKPLPSNPALEALLVEAKGHVITREDKVAQQKSWVIGNLMLDHPEITREYAEFIYTKITGE